VSADATPDRPPRLHVAALAVGCFALAAALRVSTLAAMEDANPLYAVALLDEAVYLDLANGAGAGEPWFLAPLYPALLALLDVTTRHGAALVNVVLGSLTAALAAVGGAHQGRSLVGGGVAGGIVALAGAFVFLDTTVGTETLVALLTLAGVLGIARATALRSARALGLSGAALGLAALARANALAALIGALPMVVERARSDGRVAGARAALLALGGAGAVLLCGAVWSASSGGSFSPFPWAGGVNVFLANNAWARQNVVYGTDLIANNPLAQKDEAWRLAVEGAGRDLSASEVGDWWRGRAFDEVSAAPGAALTFLGRKALLAFTADEIGGNHDAIAEAPFAPWTRLVPVTTWWILALGAGGWWITRRKTPSADALALAAVGHLATLALLFPLARYRLPIVPVFAVLAGAGVGWIVRREASRRVLLGAAGCVACVTVLAWLPLREPTRYEAWLNLGEAVLAAGEGDPIPWYQKAVAEKPDLAPAHERLGYFAIEAGDNEAALRHYAVAEGSRLTRRNALLNKARVLINLKRYDDALATNDVLVREYPGDAGIVAEGALLAFHAGRLDETRRRLDAARSIDPDHSAVLDLERRLRR